MQVGNIGDEGDLSDDEGDAVLIETSEFKGFSRPATDTGSHSGGAYFGAT